MSRFLPLMLFCLLARAEPFPKVDSDLAAYDQRIKDMKATFSSQPAGDPADKAWVQRKLQFLLAVDQYCRDAFLSWPHDHGYTGEEAAYFSKQFLPRMVALDRDNTKQVRELLTYYDWFRISVFGPQADYDGWLLVQHADRDPAFQKAVLMIMEGLYQIGETKPAHYAYLYDRVAASYADPSKQKPQRYGTQGRCTGPGTWEPIPIEDPDHVDERRASMGLSPMADYLANFKTICH